MARPENKSKEQNDRLIKPWEEFWIVHHPFLLEQGYRLRDRYDPNWVPSWRKPQRGSKKKLNPLDYPDSRCMGHPIVDAIRISDGRKVAIKLVKIDEDIPILEYLNSPELLADPRNHTVPLLDKILVPNASNDAWIVMPLLLDFDHTEFHFQFTSEIIEITTQFLEGLELMHEHRIAHRDACRFNLMVDSQKLVPNGNFCFYRSYLKADWKSRVDSVVRRTVAPLKYYFIDFETACWYPPEEKNPLCIGRYGQVKDIPEMSETVPYNPFKFDVYQLGTALSYLVKEYDGTDFLKPLVEAMTRQDPEQRPTAAEANRLFQSTISSFTEADMSRRVWYSHWPEFYRRRIEFPKKTFKQKILLLLGIKR